MPNFWAFKISRKHWIYHKNKNIRNWMLVLVYSPYYLNLFFPHLVVILTTLKTPKNILAFSTQIFRLFWMPPKNPYLIQATKKKYLPNLPTQTNSRNWQFQTQNNPLIIPVTWNPVYLPLPDGKSMQRNAWVHPTMDGHSLIVVHVIQAQSSTLWYHHK